LLVEIAASSRCVLFRAAPRSSVAASQAHAADAPLRLRTVWDMPNHGIVRFCYRPEERPAVIYFRYYPEDKRTAIVKRDVSADEQVLAEFRDVETNDRCPARTTEKRSQPLIMMSGFC
jgi:hypothetical protein